MNKIALIIFAKNLVRDKVKTRLAASIGADEALKVYKLLLQHTHAVTVNLSADKLVFYSNSINEDDLWKREHFKKYLQIGNDLGERMKDAFTSAFQQGYEKVAIIGTDCYQLTSQIIKCAFEHLQHHDVVIGPAADGGYYLLGLRRTYPELFCDIEWSTGTVLQKTIDKCHQLELRYTLLEQLHDIDEEKDLVHMINVNE